MDAALSTHFSNQPKASPAMKPPVAPWCCREAVLTSHSDTSEPPISTCESFIPLDDLSPFPTSDWSWLMGADMFWKGAMKPSCPMHAPNVEHCSCSVCWHEPDRAMYSFKSHEPTLCSTTNCRHAHIWHLPRSPFMHAEKALLQPTENVPVSDLAAENLPVFLLLYNKLAGGQAALKIQPLKMFSHVCKQMFSGLGIFFLFSVLHYWVFRSTWQVSLPWTPPGQ